MASFLLRVLSDDLADVQARQRQRRARRFKRNVGGVVGAGEEIAAGCGDALGCAREMHAHVL